MSETMFTVIKQMLPANEILEVLEIYLFIISDILTKFSDEFPFLNETFMLHTDHSGKKQLGTIGGCK